MTGHPDPHTLALWVGGDLDGHAAPKVKLHLEACPNCRKTVEEIEATQLLLQFAIREPSEAELLGVRRGISRGLRHRRRMILWSWSLGSAAAILVLLFAVVTPPPPPVPPAQKGMVQLPLPQRRMYPGLEIAEVKRVERRSSRRAFEGVGAGLRAVNFARGPHGLTQMRLTTTDPNIVIILPSTETAIEQ
jgi:hypothetical protein